MNIERFQQMAEAFGGDLSRWPQAAQGEAGALLRSSDAARRIIAGELALDGLLDRAGPVVDDARAERAAAAIFARLDAAPLPALLPAPLSAPLPAPLSAPLPMRWSASFIAVMALVGVISGALAPDAPLPAASLSAASSPAVSATAVVATDGWASVAGSGYYSTRYLAAWAQ